MQIIVVSNLQLWCDIMSDSIASVIKNADINTISDLEGIISFKSLSKTDLAFVNLSMPDKESLDVIRYILNIENGPEVFVGGQLSQIDLLKESLKYRIHSYVLEDYGKDHFYNMLEQFDQGVNTLGRKSRKQVKQWVEKNESFISTVKLSKREREILRLICNEKTSAEISSELFISEHTVLTHRKNLLKKVGCKNTVGLVHYAYTNNII